jgi:uncharacterized protein DUF1501
MEKRILVPDNVTGKLHSVCCSRRGFLRSSLAAGLAAAAVSSFPGARTAFGEETPIPPGSRLAGHGQAKRAIFIHLDGGPSHIDLFDPKPGRETGGPFKAVQTRLPGVYLGEHLPSLAKLMPQLALIRSMTSTEGNHTRARTLVRTAYPPEATVKHPTFGSSLSAEIAPGDYELPNFITIGAQAEGPAFLGVKHAPFVFRSATRPIENIAYHERVGKERVIERRKLLGKMQEDFAEQYGAAVTAGQNEMFDKAQRLVDSPLKDAFDLEKVDAKVRARYGESQFAQGCLMARRLLEVGVTCVEVTLGGWDTHIDNFARVETACGPLDGGLSALLADLSERGMLDSTLVVCMGEFGRTPRINANVGRDHYARAFSAVVAGGGVLGGQVIGATDADGANVADNPVAPADLHASFWHAFGVDPWTEYQANDRPITLTPKTGKIVRQLFV